jgi:hypothetical protein
MRRAASEKLFASTTRAKVTMSLRSCIVRSFDVSGRETLLFDLAGYRGPPGAGTMGARGRVHAAGVDCVELFGGGGIIAELVPRRQ